MRRGDPEGAEKGGHGRARMAVAGQDGEEFGREAARINEHSLSEKWIKGI